MAQEIGFTELQRLVRRSWRLIAALAAVFAIAAFSILAFLRQPVYQAVARLLVTPLAIGYEGAPRSIAVYRNLAGSDEIVAKAHARLVAEGVLAKDAKLRVGNNIFVAALEQGRRGAVAADNTTSMLVMTAKNGSPETAAAITNTWAEVFVEQSRSMFGGAVAGSEAVIGAQLDPTRAELEKVESERDQRLEELRSREEETTAAWDRRIANAKKKAESKYAEYNGGTRRLMEETVDRVVAPEIAPPGSALRSRLLGIVSVRAQLAQTPRVLALEKAASDDTLAEMIAEGEPGQQFDTTLVSEELNPLFDELTTTALRLESELKRSAQSVPETVSRALGELGKIQLERAAGLVALIEESRLELRTLKRQRSRALEDLLSEELKVQREYGRRVSQLIELEARLSDQLNRTLVSRLLEGVEAVTLSARAVPPSDPLPKQIPLKVAVAAFLGGLLGLMIALFRSAA